MNTQKTAFLLALLILSNLPSHAKLSDNQKKGIAVTAVASALVSAVGIYIWWKQHPKMPESQSAPAQEQAVKSKLATQEQSETKKTRFAFLRRLFVGNQTRPEEEQKLLGGEQDLSGELNEW